jgi:PAS domain-containing protein
MASAQLSHALSTAVHAVIELLEEKRRVAKDGDGTALQAGAEELSVIWDELQSQSEHLARERQRFEDLFQFLPEACVITDVVGHVREANQAAAELLGVAAGSLAGKPFPVFLATEHRLEFRNRLTRFYAADFLGRETWGSAILPRGASPANVLLTVRAINPPHPSDLCWLIRPAP